MTTFASEIVKTEQPASAELFEIREAFAQFTYFTSHQTPIEFGGHTYIPMPITRTGFSIESSFKTIEVRVSAPINELFGIVLAKAPYKSSTIRITKVFVDAPDAANQLMFYGIIALVTVNGGVATGTCRSDNGRLNQKIPRVFYQTNCNHMFCDQGCKMDLGSYSFDVQVGAVSGSDITLLELDGIPSGTFQGGSLSNGYDERLITKQDGQVCTILIPFTDPISITDFLKLRAPCDGSAGICKGYNNLQNFLGFPYIPTKNAVIWGFK